MQWKYLLNDNQNSFDCQVVTAVNAYYCLTGKRVIDKKKYQSLVEMAKALHGAAIDIEEVYRELGLKILWRGNSLYNLQHQYQVLEKGRGKVKRCKLPLPIAWSVWHKRRGFHQTLIVDECLTTECVRVANFRQVTSAEGWMFEEDMYMYRRPRPNDDSADFDFMLFGLPGDKELQGEIYE